MGIEKDNFARISQKKISEGMYTYGICMRNNQVLLVNVKHRIEYLA